MIRYLLGPAVLVLLLAGPACRRPVPEAPASTAVVIRGARLIDGTGGPPIDNAVIVVDAGRIVAAGRASATPVPKGASEFPAAGRVAIPGLIDAHVHYFGNTEAMRKGMAAQLAYGVTTVRSIGTDQDEQLAAILQARGGLFPAPRVFTAGLGFTHPKGHPAAIGFVNRPSNAAEARAAVGTQAANKVDFIKIWVDSKHGTLSKIAPGVQAAILEEARLRLLPVVAHIFDEADVRTLAAAGVTDFLHTVRDKRFPDPALIDFCREKDLSFTPTLTVIEANWHFAEHPEALDDPQLVAVADLAALEPLRSPAERARRIVATRELSAELTIAQRFVRAASAAGVRIAAGSDSNGTTIPHGWATHHELELLVAAGLKPLEAIRAATGIAAQVVGRGQPAFGTIEPGKVADLVLLEADPESDIRNTRKIHLVMQAGRWLTPPRLVIKR